MNSLDFDSANSARSHSFLTHHHKCSDSSHRWQGTTSCHNCLDVSALTRVCVFGCFFSVECTLPRRRTTDHARKHLWETPAAGCWRYRFINAPTRFCSRRFISLVSLWGMESGYWCISMSEQSMAECYDEGHFRTVLLEAGHISNQCCWINISVHHCNGEEQIACC